MTDKSNAPRQPSRWSECASSACQNYMACCNADNCKSRALLSETTATSAALRTEAEALAKAYVAERDALLDWKNRAEAAESALAAAISRIERGGRDAAIGAQVRKLVDGGPFDLTDSPKSFVSNCQRFVRDADAALAAKGEG